MSIESDIFKRREINFQKLKDYGFTKESEVYKYSQKFLDDFRADVIVDNKGIVSGKVYDLNAESEYTNFRIEDQAGEFLNLVREEYKKILNDIAKTCSQKIYFITDQANRITKAITDMYNNEPEFIWEKFPGYGIFRNLDNEKWYGLIMNIDNSKIDKKLSGEIEVLNLKLDEQKIPNLLKKQGIYPAYHMNKKNWVTITLDDTLSDEKIIEYIKESHKFTETKNEWIIPINPKFYDIINYFNSADTINLKQSTNIKPGDIVYLYVAAPYSAILYKCLVTEINIPYQYQDKNLTMNKVMQVKLMKKFNDNEYPFTKLKDYGIKAVRGPRRMPEKLSKIIGE